MPFRTATGGDTRLFPAPPRVGEKSLPDTKTGSALDPNGTTYTKPLDSKISLWTSRVAGWASEFNSNIVTEMQENWQLWQNDDMFPAYGKGEEWRDRTTIPSPFKWIETLLPRFVLAVVGGRDWFGVEAVGDEDLSYEEKVKQTLLTALDNIGKDSPESRLFIQRVIDAFRYCLIVGNVWFKVRWRKYSSVYRLAGKGVVEEVRFNGPDIDWLTLDSLAVDLNPNYRRWAVERILTSLQALEAENARFKAVNGVDLYPNLAELASAATREETLRGSALADQPAISEPEDTVGWPTFGREKKWCLEGETPVELWLCWDNEKQTLTKIANRCVVLDHGAAPTPRGLDPYFGVPAQAVPGRVYGRSLLQWAKDLAHKQTKISRARMDEVMLGIFQQFLTRTGLALPANQFLKPGGHMTIPDPLGGLGGQSRPLGEDFLLLQRRPVMPEAYNEEQVAQQQAEIAIAADQLFQGAQATDKSRDVPAAEISARITQGNGRHQLIRLYNDSVFTKPLLHKLWDELRANLGPDSTMQVRVKGRSEPVDALQLERNVNFRVGGGVFELTHQNRASEELPVLMALTNSPTFAPLLEPRKVLGRIFQNLGWKETDELVRSEQAAQETSNAAQIQAMANQMQEQAGATGDTPPTPVMPPLPTSPPESGGGELPPSESEGYFEPLGE